nr:DUF2243 domain-containing protein [Sinorhizobium medicae]
MAFMGFGAWHVVDAVLSHWLLGLHRIKMDSTNPLYWDLLWLAVFGVGPLMLGWRFLKRPPPGPPSRHVPGFPRWCMGDGQCPLQRSSKQCDRGGMPDGRRQCGIPVGAR